MKRIKTLLLALLSLAPSGSLFAQGDISIGRRYTVYSDLLGEEREYQVWLPPSYASRGEDGSRYPVIYLLDGELYFHLLTAVHHAFSRGNQPAMPESIVVGIVNTDRTRDLTPTRSAYGRDGTIPPNAPETGGGTDTFIRFLTEELRETIEREYRTDGTNTLIGHSFGGLCCLHALLRYTDRFDTYVALDPSLWWDNARLAAEAEVVFGARRFENKRLYLGIAGKMRPGVQSIHQSVSGSFIEGVLPVGAKNGLEYAAKIFGDETHGSVMLPGLTDAFRQLYAP